MLGRRFQNAPNTIQRSNLGRSGIQGTTAAQDTPIPESPQMAPSIPTQAPSQPMYSPQMAPGLAMQAASIPSPAGWATPTIASFAGGWGRLFMPTNAGVAQHENRQSARHGKTPRLW